MALSGNETTRIGGYLAGVGKRLAITAKEAAAILAGALISVRKPEVIRLVETGYRTLVPGQSYTILMRSRKPGSLIRDGEYGY